jgi:hypothetical protein
VVRRCGARGARRGGFHRRGRRRGGRRRLGSAEAKRKRKKPLLATTIREVSGAMRRGRVAEAESAAKGQRRVLLHRLQERNSAELVGAIFLFFLLA